MTAAYKYEDVSDFNGRYGYVFPNEDLAIWRDFVRGKHIRRAAAICSGGEVGLLCLLPTVRDELILVDHSYCAIRYALQKYLLIQKLGFRRTAELITEPAPRKALQAALAKVNADLPEKVRTAGNRYTYAHNADEPVVTRGFDYGIKDYIDKMWKEASPYVQRSCRNKLDKIKFIHGSYADLADKGPFDLFYLSNAQQDGNGNRGTPSLAPVTKCVRPGGHVIVAGDYNGASYAGGGKGVFNSPEGWKLIERRESVNHTGMYVSWEYRLFQIGERET